MGEESGAPTRKMTSCGRLLRPVDNLSRSAASSWNCRVFTIGESLLQYWERPQRLPAGEDLDYRCTHPNYQLENSFQVPGPLDLAGRFAGESSCCARDEKIGLMLARLKPSPFKATARAGRSRLHYLAGRTRASAPPWTVCRFPGGQECAPQCWRARRPSLHSSSHTVSSKDARLALLQSRCAIARGDSPRSIHSRKSGARSG